MRRRDFITLAGGAAAWPLAARAQQSDRVRRIGWMDLIRADDPVAQTRVAAVRGDLEKSGWIFGRNLQIDYRWGVTSVEIAQRSGVELLSLAPDVILCSGGPAVQALQKATNSVPIVFVLVAEPVAQGFVQSLGHPGANITGFTFLERTVGAKWLALLKEAAPRTKRVAYIFNPKASPFAHFYYESIEEVAEKMSVQTSSNPVNEPTDIKPIVAQLGADGGVIFNPTPSFSTISSWQSICRRGIAYPPSTGHQVRLKQAALSATALICSISIARRRDMSTASSREKSRPTFRYNSQLNSILSSISRSPRHWA
jgi:putative tryptophan/tyrosine transport system substrate-binding protein